MAKIEDDLFQKLHFEADILKFLDLLRKNYPTNVFRLELPSGHPDFDPSDLTMDPATLTISSVSLTVGAFGNTVMTELDVAQSTKTLIRKVTHDFTADVYAKLDPVTYQVNENVFTQKSIDMSCSAGGATPITYTLKTAGGEALPPWVSLFPSKGMLIINTPALEVTTTYNFIIDIFFNGATDEKPVIIQVLADCLIEDCKTCKFELETQCETCEDWYDLTADYQCTESIEVKDTVIAATYGSQVSTSNNTVGSNWCRSCHFRCDFISSGQLSIRNVGDDQPATTTNPASNH